MSIGQLIWRRFWINPRSPHEKYLKIQNRSNPSQRKSKAARSICYFFLYRLIVAIVNDFDIVVLTQCHYVYSSSCSFMASFFFFFLIFTFNKDLHTNLRLKIHGLRFSWSIWRVDDFDLICFVARTVGPLPTHSLRAHAWSVREETKRVPTGTYLITNPRFFF